MADAVPSSHNPSPPTPEELARIRADAATAAMSEKTFAAQDDLLAVYNAWEGYAEMQGKPVNASAAADILTVQRMLKQASGWQARMNEPEGMTLSEADAKVLGVTASRGGYMREVLSTAMDEVPRGVLGPTVRAEIEASVAAGLESLAAFNAAHAVTLSRLPAGPEPKKGR